MEVPESACGLKLYRIFRGDLIACEAVAFEGKQAAVNIILNRARLSGRVEVGGDIRDHFADIMDHDGDVVGEVALDAKSYSSLKNHWMRCKLQAV